MNGLPWNWGIAGIEKGRSVRRGSLLHKARIIRSKYNTRPATLYG